MDRYSLITEKEALFSLNEAFIEICGDKHRVFIENIGLEAIKLGKTNAELWVNQIVKRHSRFSYFKYLKEDELDKVKSELKLFFEDEEILIEENNYSEVSHYDYSDGIDNLKNKVVKTIKDSDIKIIKTDYFNYFKQFKLSANPRFTSVTLYSEGGLGLDQYKKNNLKYYQEERELCYMVEAIVYKYHYLGMLLKKQEVLLEWIDKITNNITNEMNHYIKSSLSQIIYGLSIDSASDIIIEDIQNITGVTDSFMTNNQVRESIKRNVRKNDKNG